MDSRIKYLTDLFAEHELEDDDNNQFILFDENDDDDLNDDILADIIKYVVSLF